MNPARLTEIPVVFYRTSGGAEPVLDWRAVLYHGHADASVPFAIREHAGEVTATSDEKQAA